jgi:hypothetical protein
MLAIFRYSARCPSVVVAEAKAFHSAAYSLNSRSETDNGLVASAGPVADLAASNVILLSPRNSGGIRSLRGLFAQHFLPVLLAHLVGDAHDLSLWMASLAAVDGKSHRIVVSATRLAMRLSTTIDPVRQEMAKTQRCYRPSLDAELDDFCAHGSRSSWLNDARGASR